jgi:glycerophosphoryl diester phosphodiesterase
MDHSNSLSAQQLVAHRGWQNRYPENSLAGIKAAIAAGAQHIEIDVQLTADKVPVLCHDHKLDRLCGSPEHIDQLSYAALKKLSFHEPERLGEQFKPCPLLSLSDCLELLNQHPGLTFYVEIKRHALRTFGQPTVLESLLPLLNHYCQNIVVISFDIEILQALKQLLPALKVGPVLLSWTQWQEQSLLQLKATTVFSDVDLIPRGCDISALPCPVVVYEVADPAMARELLQRGVSAVETFAIGELLTAV